MTYTTTSAAKKLKCHPETIKRHCREYGIGELISARVRVLTAKDVARLKRLVQKRGRPKVS